MNPDPAGTGRDPEFIRRNQAVLERFANYYKPEVRGFEHLPEKGPFLIVGNHSGGMTPPDLPILMTAWWRSRGVEEPVYGLFHSAFLSIPGIGPACRRAGGMDASPDNAERVLSAGGSVVVFPGGDHEVFRPWSERDKIVFAGRKGFIRLALKTGVPMIPMVSCGAHDSVIVLSRGDRLARFLPHLRLMRAKVNPIMLPLPPLPTQVTVQLGPPIRLSDRYGPEHATDPDVLDKLYDEITGSMQATMDALAKERRR